MKTNYHGHCRFCDGRGEPEEIVLAALDKGFDILGFSSHSPMEGEDWTLREEDVLAYGAAIRDLAEKYRDRILILLGMEMDFNAHAPLWRFRHWGNLALDYALGSVHMIYGRKTGRHYSVDGPVEEILAFLDQEARGDARILVEEYYKTLSLMVRRESFDFVGHLDVVRKRNKKLGLFDEAAPWYITLVKTSLEEIRRKGLPVEINTGGRLRGATDDFYPSQPILRECRRLEIPILINSDAHRPEDLDGFFDEARQAAREAGYRERMVLDASGWHSRPF